MAYRLRESAMIVVPLLGVLALGCAIQLKPEAIVPSVSQQHVHHGSVSLGTIGSIGGGMKLSAEEFFQVHHQALVAAGVFSEVLPQADATDYQLQVRLINARSPSRAFSMTAGVTSRWRLTQFRGDRTFEEIFTASHSVGVSEAFVGSERVRLAMEGALRKSILAGIAWLSALDLCNSQ